MNLELVINNENWKVIVENNKDNKSYWMANTKDKVLVIHNYNLEKAKYNAWVQYQVRKDE